MINFIKIYEFFFKSSFNVRGDTELTKQYGKDGHKYALIIKRSWIYGLYTSISLVGAFFIMLVNMYLAYLSIDNETVRYTVITFLGLNILFATYSSIKYLMHFKRISGKSNFIEDISSLEKKSHEGDILFIRFFNQATLNYFLFIGLIVFHIINFAFNFNKGESGLYQIGFGILDILLLSVQA